jgi:hypothetical protein
MGVLLIRKSLSKFLIISSLIFHSSVQSVTYVDHAVAQYAGEIGLLALGLGKDHGRYSISGLYGVVPAAMAGGMLIETITLRQTYSFYEWDRLALYGGLNVFHVLGLHYEVSRYGDPPSTYYPIGSIRGLLNLGISFQIKHKTFFYFEAGLNDIWIANWVANTNVVNPTDHVSMGMGLKYNF